MYIFKQITLFLKITHLTMSNLKENMRDKESLYALFNKLCNIINFKRNIIIKTLTVIA